MYNHIAGDLRRTAISFALLGLYVSANAYADDLFNPAMLEQNGSVSSNVNLDTFAKKRQQAPGIYHVSLLVNNNLFAARDVVFQSIPGQLELTPCFTRATLKDIGVRTEVLPGLAKMAGATCIDIAQAIPGSESSFDFENQRLKVSIPQAAMDNQARGYIPPEQWEQGISALLANYQFSGSHTDYQESDGSSDQQYLNLRSGFNLDAWRFRNYSTYTKSDSGEHWDSSSTYVQRNIEALKGELTMGDDFTPSDIFDSVQFRGLQIASDDNMLPDSMKGFAPVVRGIAKSSAKVTIRQNGYVIYQSYVSPGAFTINDLYPTSNSGDLDVTVTESDGSETHFVQPFSSVPMLQREGHLKYGLTVGEYHDTTSTEDPMFGQMTLMRGFARGLTLYGGSQVSDKYLSGALGAGQNLGDWGALSADITAARADLYDDTHSTGNAYRVLYAKSLAEIGMSLQLSGSRYSSDGYYNFSDAMNLGRSNDSNNYDYNNGYKKKDKYQISLSQTLAGWGSMYLNASRQRYWNQDNDQSITQLGYSNSFYGISYSMSYSYMQNPGSSDDDQQLAFNMSVPLSRFLNNAWATYNITNDSHGRTSQQAGINGTLLKDRNLNYSVQESYTNKGTGESGNASLSYLGSYGQSNVGYNYDDNQHQITYGVSGGIVAHQHGVTLSQQLGETVALIQAPGADGVVVQNQTGVKTDWRGYTILPYVMPYRKNVISLDPGTLPNNVELDGNSKNVVPTQGAVVLASFNARTGYKSLMTLTINGKPVPFGATVQDSSSPNNATFVGDNGQVYLSGLSAKGHLLVQWGVDSDQQCQINYALPDDQMSNATLSFITDSEICKP